MNPYKFKFASKTSARSLADALRGADVFIGVSKGNVLSSEMLQQMAERPIVFAMANPDPEIPYAEAVAARADVILATGRSDLPNQVNNVLCFPFIFRGALDTRSTLINHAMQIAASQAIAEIAREDVPSVIRELYQLPSLAFGPTYILPKPFDERLRPTVATAVAKAAMESGVARLTLDLNSYRAAQAVSRS
jgi:malate dehydrogenase (oxaloacetate-decarboxylating)(NADP+)